MSAGDIHNVIDARAKFAEVRTLEQEAAASRERRHRGLLALDEWHCGGGPLRLARLEEEARRTGYANMIRIIG